MSAPDSVVFVFGSNRQGRHGKGAALHAVKKWGAIYGQAKGRQGNAYAIITKELRRDQSPVELDEVARGVRDFMHYAIIYPSIRFKVSAIGCGLAGFTPEDIAPLFLWRGNNEPRPNVILPPEFREVLKNRPREEPAQELRYTQSPAWGTLSNLYTWADHRALQQEAFMRADMHANLPGSVGLVHHLPPIVLPDAPPPLHARFPDDDIHDDEPPF